MKSKNFLPVLICVPMNKPHSLNMKQLAGKITEYGTQFEKLEELKNTQGAEFKQQAEYDDLKTETRCGKCGFSDFSR